MKFEVREIDAMMMEGMDGNEWCWNSSFHIGEFTTNAKNIRRAFTNYLRKLDISFLLNRTVIEFDGDVYEILDRKTKAPLFAAIPA